VAHSPARLLTRADIALREVFEACRRFPEALAELIATIGEDSFRELQAARDAVERCVHRLDAPDHKTDSP